MLKETKDKISFFERYLSIWVLLCMAAGILIAKFMPSVQSFLQSLEFKGQNIILTVLMWLMIYPMMVRIDFKSLKNVGKHPQGIIISTIASWAIKPFLMFGLSTLFFHYVFSQLIPANLANDFVIGAVLLGTAPCTAMVFVWSSLTNGDPAQTLVQISINDILILFLFVPLVQLLLGLKGISLPMDVLLMSLVLFVLIPLVGGFLSRYFIIKNKGKDYLENNFIKSLTE